LFVFKAGTIIETRELLDAVQDTMRTFPAQVVIEEQHIESFGVLLEKLERNQPDVLLLDLALVADSLEDTIRQVKSAASQPKVIVLAKAPEPGIILKCLRAGADEFLYPPLQEELRAALTRMSSERMKVRAGTRPRGKVIGFLSCKGGSGATTAACHVAVELARLTELEVLLADFDLESGVIEFLMKTQARYTLLDALDNIQRLDMSFWKALVTNGTPGLEIVSAPAPGRALTKIYRDPEDYRNVLRFSRANYDWTVADLGQGLGYVPQCVVEELDSLFLLTTLDVPAMHQSRAVTETLLEKGVASHRLHLVMNRWPRRSELTIEEVERMLGQAVYATVQNDYVEMNNAYAEGSLAAPNGVLGREFQRLAAKIAGVEPKKPKKRFSLF
jgi:pilus assembly protein CpaE